MRGIFDGKVRRGDVWVNYRSPTANGLKPTLFCSCGHSNQFCPGRQMSACLITYPVESTLLTDVVWLRMFVSWLATIA